MNPDIASAEAVIHLILKFSQRKDCQQVWQFITGSSIFIADTFLESGMKHLYIADRGEKPILLALKEDVNLQDYLTFDDNLPTSVGQINTDLVDWRETAREEAIGNVLNEQRISTISSSGNEPYEEDNRTIRQMATTEALKILDELSFYFQNQNSEDKLQLFQSNFLNKCMLKL